MFLKKQYENYNINYSFFHIILGGLIIFLFKNKHFLLSYLLGFIFFYYQLFQYIFDIRIFIPNWTYYYNCNFTHFFNKICEYITGCIIVYLFY
jgi:hypothetical protein